VLTIKTTSQLVAEALRDLIVRGDIALGERLQVRELADRLGVSSTPVREALNRLIAEGLVTSVPHTGIFVSDPTENELRDLFQARLCLELCMATMAKDHVTPEQIGTLRHLAGISGSRDFRREGFEEMTFHRYFAQIAGNSHLARVREQVNSLLRVYFVKYISGAGPEAQAQHAREEEAICHALESGDLADLEQAIKVHTRAMERIVLQAYAAERG